ncbi:hypothetical protein [Sulfurimonas sp.]|uniref:hypothetical protein n=1 Tax=Sulfurimonas sp. TaxID=2022749 RepID=UPI002AAF9523|nr:hypothetical protein [Sulfurimonas sp.]
MKKLLPFFIIIVFVGIIVGVFLSLASQNQMIVTMQNNKSKQPIQMQINKYQDSDCGMLIDNMEYISQVISPSSQTWFFHDHGGFVKWLQDKEFKDEAVIWVMSKDSKRWIDARVAFYSLVDKTPMGYGFGAYEKKALGYVDFDTMRLRMLRGETLNNPRIRKQLLGTK